MWPRCSVQSTQARATSPERTAMPSSPSLRAPGAVTTKPSSIASTTPCTRSASASATPRRPARWS
jgi:hypothetical protein